MDICKIKKGLEIGLGYAEEVYEKLLSAHLGPNGSQILKEAEMDIGKIKAAIDSISDHNNGS